MNTVKAFFTERRIQRATRGLVEEAATIARGCSSTGCGHTMAWHEHLHDRTYCSHDGCDCRRFMR